MTRSVTFDFLFKIVFDDDHVDRFPIDQNLDALSRATSIVPKRNMKPLLGWNGFFRFNTDRITRPKMYQRRTQFAVFDQQLITATCGISPSSGTMVDHATLKNFLVVGNVDSGCDCERLMPTKVANREFYFVITREF